MDTLIVNLFAGPGAGKSTLASGIFYNMKMKSLNCELVTEYAKDKVWEENWTALGVQFYVSAKQFYRQEVLIGKVNAVITDSPILLSTMYNSEKDEKLRELFNSFIIGSFKRLNNLNFFIKRKKKYVTKGRMQTQEEAVEIDNKIIKLLDDNDIEYHAIEGTPEGLIDICNKIYERLSISSSS